MNRNSGRVWINFKELRKRLKFEEVLRHYKVEVVRNGDQHHGPCPLPQHKGRRDTASFSANLEKGIFQCFSPSCGAQGNLLDFAALIEGMDPEDGAALRKVAVGLQARFCPEGASSRKKAPSVEVSRPVAEPCAPRVLVNAPLDFELKSLEHGHESIEALGVELKVAVHFGIGFCSRGFLKGRVAIPLHDDGKLVGYAGLLVKDTADSEGGPSYLFPERRERDGTVFEFDRSLLLYNANRLEKPCSDLIIVQNFLLVWRLHQCGLRNVVAIIASRCSERQHDLVMSLTSSTSHIWIASEANDEGKTLASSIINGLSSQRFIRWSQIPEESELRNLPTEAIKKYFTA